MVICSIHVTRRTVLIDNIKLIFFPLYRIIFTWKFNGLIAPFPSFLHLFHCRHRYSLVSLFVSFVFQLCQHRWHRATVWICEIFYEKSDKTCQPHIFMFSWCCSTLYIHTYLLIIMSFFFSTGFSPFNLRIAYNDDETLRYTCICVHDKLSHFYFQTICRLKHVSWFVTQFCTRKLANAHCCEQIKHENINRVPFSLYSHFSGPIRVFKNQMERKNLLSIWNSTVKYCNKFQNNCNK